VRRQGPCINGVEEEKGEREELPQMRGEKRKAE
jgi:hypothetical protein